MLGAGTVLARALCPPSVSNNHFCARFMMVIVGGQKRQTRGNTQMEGCTCASTSARMLTQATAGDPTAE